MIGRLRRALPKREVFTLKDEHVFRIEEASRPNVHPVMAQHRANAVWGAIARELGFDMHTVQPIDEDDRRRFTAVPLPNDERNGGCFVLPELPDSLR